MLDIYTNICYAGRQTVVMNIFRSGGEGKPLLPKLRNKNGLIKLMVESSLFDFEPYEIAFLLIT